VLARRLSIGHDGAPQADNQGRPLGDVTGDSIPNRDIPPAGLAPFHLSG
jgi:hypothetical protein